MRMLITGASSGIGKALYEHYREEGTEVCGISRRGPDISQDFKDDPDAWGRIGWGMKGTLFDWAVLNAGVMSLEETGKTDWEELRVNFLPYSSFLRRVAGGQFIRPGGSIVMNASSAGVVGHIEAPFYAALKAAIINLGRSYAKILADRKIRVNCFSPGFTKTDLVPGEFPEELLEAVPLGRRALPEEMIPVVDMLLKCEYITGQNIVVDGGLTL